MNTSHDTAFFHLIPLLISHIAKGAVLVGHFFGFGYTSEREVMCVLRGESEGSLGLGDVLEPGVGAVFRGAIRGASSSGGSGSITTSNST